MLLQEPHGTGTDLSQVTGVVVLPSGPLDADVFDLHYQQFATLVGTHHTSVLPGRVYAEHPDLHAWVLQVRDAYNTWQLTDDQYARMEALRDWTWLTSEATWLTAYRDLEELLLGGDAPDLADERAYLERDDLVWAREQQLNRGQLSPQHVTALEALPGWVWETRCQQRARQAQEALTFLLLYRAGAAERPRLERLLALDPDELCAALENPGENADLAALVADPTLVGEALAFTEAAAHLPEAAPVACASFIAGHLEEFTAGTLDVLALTALSYPDATHIVTAYRGYHVAVSGRSPHETYTVCCDTDRDLVELVGETMAAVLRRAGISWQHQLRQHTAEEVRAVVGDTKLVTVLIQTDPARTAAMAPPAGPAGPAPVAASASADPASDIATLRARHIAFLNLSVRTYNVLMREGLHRVGDLLDIEDARQLLSLRGLGETCLTDLRTKLTAAGAAPLF